MIGHSHGKQTTMAKQITPSLICLVLLFTTFSLYAQRVGIGTASPEASALLDLTSTDKGILIPRMTTVQRNAIATPAAGLMVYDTNLMGFWYYNGSSWLSVGGPDDKWKMYGNTGTNSTHFLGTADDQPMRFRLNNLKAGTWDGANRNYSLGVGALDSITTGKGNIAIGTKALFSNKTQNGLVAVGDSSLYSNTTGVQNTAIGSQALRKNTNGSNNVASGHKTLYSNTIGSNNVANGHQALYSNTTGSDNLASGSQALYFNTTGSYNVASGYVTLLNNKTGSYNVASGFVTLLNNTTGSYNVAYGSYALYANTTGNFLVAVGDSSLYSNTTGVQNTAIGSKALRTNTSGSRNTAFGFQALSSNTGSANTAVGNNALRLNTSGNILVAVGDSCLYSNTTGVQNTAIGSQALKRNLTGFSNVANGYHSLYNNLIGFNNVAIGSYALDNNTTGGRNSAFGHAADVNATNLFNSTAIGANSLVAESNCLVLGSIIGVNGATESVNVGIGTTIPKTRLHIVGGSDANYIDTSGYLVTGDVATSNIIIDDNEIMARNNGASAPLYLQVSGGDLKIGSGTPSYKLEVGSSEAAKTGGGVWIAASDQRLKKNIRAFEDGLDILKKIRPVQFSYNGQGGIADDTSTFVGIIAQELKPVAPYMIGEFTYTAPDGQKENYMDYDGTAMTYILINAVKEQQVIIDQLKANQLASDVAHKNEMVSLRAQVEALKQLMLSQQDN